MAKKMAEIGKNCVACGNCLKACKVGALSIFKGKYAVVDLDKCVGCAACAKICPAALITIKERQQNPKGEQNNG